MSDPTFITRLDPDEDPLAAPDGLRLAVKDCIDVVGTITTAGSAAVAESASPATDDAACLAGFRAAGARIVGKANLHELCFGSSGVNPHYGTPVNPLDPSRIPGGSSSGSAVAVAAEEADVALGTDTTGSVRNPAAACGVAGLKTTWGLVPVAGTRPLAPFLDTVGVLARDVADLALGASMLHRRLTEPTAAPCTTVGRLRFEQTEPAIDAAVDSALSEAGFEVVELELPGWARAQELSRVVLFAESLITNREIWLHHRDRMGSDVAERFVVAETIGSEELEAARAHRDEWRGELAAAFARVGALALPTLLRHPPRVGAHSVAPNPVAGPVSLAGHPAVVLPLPTHAQMPASLQLVGPDLSEPSLLATAALVERAVGPHRP